MQWYTFNDTNVTFSDKIKFFSKISDIIKFVAINFFIEIIAKNNICVADVYYDKFNDNYSRGDPNP